MISANNLFLQVDVDGDGAINFSEMLTIMIEMNMRSRVQLRAAFELIDRDGKLI